MKIKDLKINFRYLGGNIACLSVDSISGESVHNDINNEEAIIIFNSLVGEKTDCQTVKSLLKENQELKKQVKRNKDNYNCLLKQKEQFEYIMSKQVDYQGQKKEFIKYLEDLIKRINPKDLDIGELNLRLDDIKFTQYLIYKEILQKYKEIIGVSNEKK